jgi:hypothetical protein
LKIIPNIFSDLYALISERKKRKFNGKNICMKEITDPDVFPAKISEKLCCKPLIRLIAMEIQNNTIASLLSNWVLPDSK